MTIVVRADVCVPLRADLELGNIRQTACPLYTTIVDVYTMDRSVRLPFELLSLILDHLGQPDVLRCAQVTRHWRSVATAHDMFYCHIVLNANGINTSSIEWEFRVSRLSNLLRSCHRRNIHASVELALVMEPDLVYDIYDSDSQPDDETFDWNSDFDESPLQFSWLERFLQALRQHLATVIRLSISGTYKERIWDALRQPAPLLRLFRTTDDLDVPYDLFAGHAPRLKCVVADSLARTNSSTSNFPAFSAVSSLTLLNTKANDLTNLTSLFPALQTLSVSSASISHWKGDPNIWWYRQLHRSAPALHFSDLHPADVLPHEGRYLYRSLVGWDTQPIAAIAPPHSHDNEF
ncbi:hypothetical protein EXIGLDRAFT_837872 [Exidia glandulosa HHB12029]|uniref:F-box domain-containing protein n=1 Tax=Exidia glandulosa HHB12029 TaxID=1314781 RepID=A0A165GD79_EXIGL|nr:hypothetical protein EXIGLDRAFT_837872 [Exidia glandulosa HHB12029]